MPVDGKETGLVTIQQTGGRLKTKLLLSTNSPKSMQNPVDFFFDFKERFVRFHYVWLRQETPEWRIGHHHLIGAHVTGRLANEANEANEAH